MVGKGGAGKSTLAASAAVAAARRGRRALVVSLDQAHSLGDVFGADAGPEDGDGLRAVCLDAPGTLQLTEIDTLALAARRWGALAGAAAVAPAVDAAGAPRAEELTVVPGAQELLGMAAVADHAESGRWDIVIVDCPATAAALRLFELPGAVADHLERAWPRHRRLGRPPTSATALVGVGIAEATAALADRIARLLADAGRTSSVVVSGPGAVHLAETRRLLTALGPAGPRPAAIVVNRAESAADGADADPLQEGLDPARRLPTIRVPRRPAEPVGSAALAAIAALVDPLCAQADAASAASAPRVRLHSGSGLDSVYEMALPLPFVAPERIVLGRIGDDLIVGERGAPRRMRLAPVLRRCTVRDAALQEGTLLINFVPDPEVWPR